MITAILVLTILSTLLILPGWILTRRKSQQSTWLLVLPFYGVGLWLMLSVTNFGSTQSLANIVEVFWAAISSIIAAYIKFFALDRFPAWRSKGIFVVYALITITVVGIRVFTPTFPE